MGWYYGWYTRSSLIEHLTKTTDSENFTFETLAKCFIGNNMWAVMQRTNKREISPDKRVVKFIVLFLIRRGGREEWGYKDVSEDMGPCEVNCPLKYLDMAPEGALDSEYATEWRESVRAYWQAKAEGRAKAATMRAGDLFMKGEKVYFYHGPYKGRYGRKATGDIIYNEYPIGSVYRMKPNGIVPLSPEDAEKIKAETRARIAAANDQNVAIEHLAKAD